jgi:hypothetical protein
MNNIQRITTCLTIALVLTACQPNVVTISPQFAETANHPIVAESDAPPSRTASPSPSPAVTATASATPAPTQTPTPLADVTRFDRIALEMLTLINAWRLIEGLAPFVPNETLQQVAQDQVDYLVSLPALPDGVELHSGPGGAKSAERARQLGWPHYATDVQTAVGEAACLSTTAALCLGYWQGSESHRKIIGNPGYREVGIAIYQYSWGIMFILDAGSRPDILPALVDPINGMLYLTSEEFSFAGGGDWIHEVTQYQILPSTADTPDDSVWLPYSPAVPLPEVGPTFAVALTDGTQTVITEVRATENVAWLPDLILAIVPPTATPEPTASATEAPSVTPTGAATATLPPPTPTAGLTSSLLIVYDENSITLINTSGQVMDFSQLALVGESVTLLVSRWQQFMLSLPLTEFPAGYCIQAWPNGLPDPGLAGGCKVRASTMYLKPEEMLWTSDFEVRLGDEVLTTCSASAGRCEVDIP